MTDTLFITKPERPQILTPSANDEKLSLPVQCTLAGKEGGSDGSEGKEGSEGSEGSECSASTDSNVTSDSGRQVRAAAFFK